MSEPTDSNSGPGRAWRWAAIMSWAVLALVLAAQTLPGIFEPRALWFSDEIRYANVFEHLLAAKKWLVMYLNGVPYPDKPPVYFWLLAALHPIFGAASPALFFTGAAVSALMFIFATLWMNRAVFGSDRGNGLAAGLCLLTCFYFIGLSHYSRMDLLFAALITCAHVCLFKAWARERAMAWCAAGFFFMALATLTKGPLGLVFPLAASVGYLAWTGSLRRLASKDAALGVVVLVLVLSAWLGGAWFMGEHEYLENIFYKQIYQRAVNASHHPQPWWHYFATLPLAWMPWTFLIFVLPLGKLASPGFWGGLMASRKTGDRGAAYLWCALVTGFAVLSAVSIKIIVYLMPLFPPLALVTARALGGLSAKASRRLYYIIAAVFALVAVNAPLANYMHHWPIEIGGVYILAGSSAAVALAAWRFLPRMHPHTALLALAGLVCLWLIPVSLLTAPSLDPVMSPKAQATLMGEYVAKGYKPVAYKIYSGTYTHYANAEYARLLAKSGAHDADVQVSGVQAPGGDAPDATPDATPDAVPGTVAESLSGMTFDQPLPAPAPAAGGSPLLEVLEVQDYYENGAEVSGLEKILTILNNEPKVVLAMRRKYWDAWEQRPSSLRIVHEQWIVDRPFVLAVQDAS